MIKLIWVTPDAEALTARIARVSNPKNEGNEATAPKLLKYCIDHGHWSPFEMTNMCVEINTSRAIARQILRHRSFVFQEFSQRYAEVDDDMIKLDLRRQDTKNRQNSIDDLGKLEKSALLALQREIWKVTQDAYKTMLKCGVAKECARALLPEGLTPSRMYMSGSVRSWVHYIQVRTDLSTQLEHRLIAEAIKEVFVSQFPTISEALNWSQK